MADQRHISQRATASYCFSALVVLREQIHGRDPRAPLLHSAHLIVETITASQDSIFQGRTTQMREVEGPTAGGQTSLRLWSQTTWPPDAADPEVKAGSAIYLFTFSAAKIVLHC